MILHIHLLGQFRVHADEQPLAGFEQKRLQALLAYLLLSGSSPVPRERAAFAFWPDSTDEQALTNLRNLLHRLRDVLPESETYLQFNRHHVWWRQSGACRFDVADFTAALAGAAAAERSGNVSATCRALEEALALYAGDLLPNCYDDWIMGERERLRQAFLHGLDQLVLLLERQQAFDPAIRYAQLLIRRDPLHEAAYRHLMRLHLATGDRANALRVYHACASQLRRELGVDPGTATQAVYDTVLHADEAPPPRSAAPQPPQMPAAPALVGREREWEQLQSAWRAAVSGHPQMILLAGETGIGKTRLAEELVAWVARQQLTTAAAHCYPTEQTLAYAPAAALLRDPALSQRLGKLDATWLTEISRLLPELAALHPGLAAPGPMTEPWQRQRLFRALTEAILMPASSAAPETAPLLLLIDDLQWCDSDTLDWLLYLLDAAASAPLLVVATACCCELDGDSPIEALRLNLERRGLVTQIELAALPPAAATELAIGLAGRALRPDEAAGLLREAEGVPLFIVEMVRAGFDFGAQEGQLTLKAEGESISPGDPHPLPPRVEAAIRRRLAGLSTTARELAQTAAVIGRTFTLETLARITTLSEDALIQGLDELWRRRIVRERGADSYDFAHDKMRVVVYAELSPGRRRQLHRRAAEALESSTPAAGANSDIAAQLAYHHLKSGD
jgi:DNA-binding SARP family transcriptional activator/DNA polymerase III delta prime subunit